ncbi:aldo/keto reductase [Allosaccharopolyspora coralli]|uniref:Aldo/keto reductase n=1 Tax=Allosaccharopolyspora coralli TaxID=2665642 RepID=A0A5Q3QAQ4_9PSEU|nr:aldo/keto reductase [Allosaccharopolyspora coralli]QGK70446.1 aldo/keto reductase [Allosaccharopolyspora coralli]
MARIGSTELDVSRLCLGGNVFGWTADEATSFALLDAYADAGGNMIDSADVYMAGAEGNSGGESEEVLGRWMASRGNRDQMVIATKVGQLPGREGLSPETVAAAAEDSLRRLQTDYIDLYYAHVDDSSVPQQDSLAAFDALVRAGKVRHVAASNFATDRLTSALKISHEHDLARFVAVQPHYNLVEREYERDQAPTVEHHNLSCFPYFGLAKGFLTGKYRPDAAHVDTGAEQGAMGWARAKGARSYLAEDRGPRVLKVLDELAAAHSVSVSAVALAWLADQPSVTAPIASARTLDQLGEILPAAEVTLSQDELEALDSASR